MQINNDRDKCDKEGEINIRSKHDMENILEKFEHKKEQITLTKLSGKPLPRLNFEFTTEQKLTLSQFIGKKLQKNDINSLTPRLFKQTLTFEERLNIIYLSELHNLGYY